MKIAIYGAGAMGTILGAYLTKSGIDTVLVNRNKEHVDRLNEQGARITGEIEMTVRVKAITPEEMNDCYDIIFLMTKQTENVSVAGFLRTKLSIEGVICTVQNGLPEISLGEVVGEERIIGATAVWGATIVEPGIVKLTSNVKSMSFQIGSLSPGNTHKVEEIKEVLQNMCPVYIEKNFMGARWSKLLLNSTFSGLSTIFGVTFGEVAKNRKMRSIAQMIVKEVIDVAKAADIEILPVQGKDIVKLMDYNGVIKKRFANFVISVSMINHKSITSGMLYDIDKGRKTEVDAINGVICDFGKRYCFPTPYNDRIVEIIHKIEEKKMKPSIENIAVFDDLISKQVRN